ncbi:hypothetical protein AAMO2058_001106200 [Amorphochlora amoebiformis]
MLQSLGGDSEDPKKSSKRKRKKEKKKKKKKKEKKSKKHSPEPKNNKKKKKKLDKRKRDQETLIDQVKRKLDSKDQKKPSEEQKKVPATPAVKRRRIGVMTPQEAKQIEKEGQKLVRVWDSDLGVHRLMRKNGEIVEECVSQDQQRKLIVQKSRYIRPSQYTGKDKFPSEHPWFGYGPPS